MNNRNNNCQSAELSRYKRQQEISVRLLKLCVPHVGMVIGEELNSHIAQLTGGYFSSVEYHMERMPGEQGV